MDSYFTHSMFIIKMWFSRRLQKISFPFAQKLGIAYQKSIWKYKERWIGTLLGLMALFLGYWANQISMQETIHQWEKQHAPSPEMLQIALESRKMKALSVGSSQYVQLLQTVPLSLDTSQTLWMTDRANWVVSTFKKDIFSQPQIYCRDCRQALRLSSTEWRILGVGWRALESALEALDLMPQAPKKLELPLKKQEVDARAIVY